MQFEIKQVGTALGPGLTISREGESVTIIRLHSGIYAVRPAKGFGIESGWAAEDLTPREQDMIFEAIRERRG